MRNWEFRGPAKTAAQISLSLKLTTGLWDEDELTYAEREQAKAEKPKKGKKGGR